MLDSSGESSSSSTGERSVIGVYLRISPPPPAADGTERPADAVLVVDPDEQHVVFEPPDGPSSSASAIIRDADEGSSSSSGSGSGSNAAFYGPFAFRHVFTEAATQEDVYDVCARPLVERMLAGYNTTLFAYGQTGTGKTYTMTGDYYSRDGSREKLCRGVVPRALEHVLAAAHERAQRDGVEVSVAVSYLEIYKEAVTDLLAAEQPEKERPPVVYLFGRPTALRSTRGLRTSGTLTPSDFISGTAERNIVSQQPQSSLTPPPPPSAAAAAAGSSSTATTTENAGGDDDKQEGNSGGGGGGSGSRLRLQTAEDGHLRVLGLVRRRVASVREGVAALHAGDARRTTAATAANAVSSRSHTIFTVHVAVVDRRRNAARSSKMNFVDLAGSERTSAVCDVASQRFKESTAINTGLHYLEQVIVSLQARAAFVPYRNSKLTHILQDSLGGRTVTAMIATVTPLAASVPESLATCHFAQRVACIANTSVLHRETVLNPMGEIRRLRREVAALQRQLLHATRGATTTSTGSSTSSSTSTFQRSNSSSTSSGSRDLQHMVQVYMESSQPVLDVCDLSECQECFALMRAMYRAAHGTRPARASSLDAVPVVPEPAPRATSSPAKAAPGPRVVAAAPLDRRRTDSALQALQQRLARDTEHAAALRRTADAHQLALRRAVLAATLHGTPAAASEQQQERVSALLQKAVQEYRAACERVEADKVALFEAAVARLDGCEYGAVMNDMAVRADRAKDVHAQAVRQTRLLRACVVQSECCGGGACNSKAVERARTQLAALCEQYRDELRGVREARDRVLATLLCAAQDEQR